MKPVDLLQGTLDMLILKTLSSGGKQHGYTIAQTIAIVSNETLKVEEGTLYPALHRLEINGFISGEWGLSANNRKARYYKLTRLGRRQLNAEAGRWDRISTAITRIMRTA